MTPNSCGDELSAARHSHRLDGRRILDAAIGAVDGESIVEEQLELLDDPGRGGPWVRAGDSSMRLPPGRVLVIGAGKAAAPMATAAERLLGSRIADGLVITNDGNALPLERVRVREASHPLPDVRGLQATDELLGIVADAGEDDLVVCLISGGASALMVRPAAGIDLEQLQRTTEILLASGAPIDDVNAIRKHLSAVKGGRLAEIASPATVLTLMLSDVVGNSLTAIGSGPTVPDPTSFASCLEVVVRHDLTEQVPGPVLDRLRRGAAGDLADTPTSDSPTFARVTNLVIGDNRRALGAAATEASRLGYRPFVLTSRLQGEARSVGRRLAALGMSCAGGGDSSVCLLAGGESTVTLVGRGRGGRNQEAALAAAMLLDGTGGVTFASVGTDGRDGPTDAAGAFADGTTVRRGRERGLKADEFLLDNDSYTFFEALGDLVRTGPTRTNVMDLQLVLVGARSHG